MENEQMKIAAKTGAKADAKIAAKSDEKTDAKADAQIAMKIVALSGSLRAGSSNAALLRAAAAFAPAGTSYVVYEGIGGLPHFNPDLDGEGVAPPAAVAELRALLGAADGVFVSSPEYAHGVPGAFKNALDWIVSSGEFGDKPVVLINASPSGGQWVRAALIETLTVMDAKVLVDVSVQTPFVRKTMLDAAGQVADPQLARQLRAAFEALIAAIAPIPAR
jgi:chromate reductase